MNKKRGISLIVLIITIVVIIILATAIIVNIAKSNIINNANEAVVKQDFKTMQEELNMYYAEQYVETKGKFDQSKFNADSTTTPSVYDVIKSLKNSQYDGKVTVENGKITLSGDIDEKIKKWAAESADVTIKDKVVGDDTNPDEIPTVPEGTAITASDIASDPLQYYGKTVDYKVLNENLVASNSIENIILAEQYDNITWKIFYSDSKNVYLIAENELKINNEKYTKMFNNSSEAVSYVNTKSNWTEFVNNVADYAVGGPTVTMFTNSWNAKYPNSAITVTGNDTNGWEINGRGYADVDNGDPLYYKENMWYLIGSKFDGDDVYPIYVKDGEICGEVIITPEYGTIKYQGMGFRPIVCLKEGITYEVVSNYLKITTKQDGEDDVVEDDVVEDENIVVNTSNATINGRAATYKNPIIPCGFAPINTSEATWNDNNNDGYPDGWNNGLVIKDEDDNEFVWVPCTLDGKSGTIKYMKRFNEYPKDDSITSVEDDIESLPMKDATTRVAEIDQINKYGGFYIGRYEAGVPANQTEINGDNLDSDVDGTPVVQRGAAVWSFISYDKSKTNAKKLYENATYVKSGLVTGTQWDTVCAWIESEKDSENNPIHDVLDNSVSWGNYEITIGNAQYDTDGKTKISGIKQTTGYSEKWKAKNIYDFGGNVSEWTGEFTQNFYFTRSGDYYNAGLSVAFRNRYDITWGGSDNISFRIVLYVM